MAQKVKVQCWGPVWSEKVGCCCWISSRSGWLLELLTELTKARRRCYQYLRWPQCFKPATKPKGKQSSTRFSTFWPNWRQRRWCWWGRWSTSCTVGKRQVHKHAKLMPWKRIACFDIWSMKGAQFLKWATSPESAWETVAVGGLWMCLPARWHLPSLQTLE